jgi:hypothetical protein
MKTTIQKYVVPALLLVGSIGVEAGHHQQQQQQQHQYGQRHHNTVSTEAGKIDFRFVDKMQDARVFHKIAKFLDKEQAVELEDGSVWTVSKYEYVKGWKEEHLVLSQNQALFSTHRYALINTDLRLAIPVTLIREPTAGENKALSIKKVDKNNHVITLSDNKEWVVHNSDRSAFDKIAKNDRVIIGANTSEVDDMIPYILIDTANKAAIFFRARTK